MLFRTTLAGRDGFVHLLLEHQSSPVKHMPLRVLEYMVAIWGRYLKEHPNTEYYPLVIPVVVNSGPNTLVRCPRPVRRICSVWSIGWVPWRRRSR